MQPTRSQERPRWGQARRLAFIDLRLQYDGRINRRDLIAYFDISPPQASADLALYQELAPQNLEYDASARVYVALTTFRPQSGRTAATHYLDELQRLARNVVDPSESFVGFVPQTGVVATPARAIASDEVANLVRAIRDKKTLQVRYQSMDYPVPQEWRLSPHALGFDGLRWHARCYCHTRRVFRDFAIGRLTILAELHDVGGIDPALDRGWNTQVPLVLVPHPALSPSQRQVVERDYGMREGHRTLECRKAMLFYTLRHLNLERLQTEPDPARQHVVVDNTDNVRRWIAEDREGAVGARVDHTAPREIT
ncbi:WYL domain-containing protein [Pseudomonas sp. R2.Fl]|nr:WYL domain-containing protein [Pseudomonas sp. R2.Fl]